MLCSVTSLYCKFYYILSVFTNINLNIDYYICYIHFKREITDDKILHSDLGAKASGVSALEPTLFNITINYKLNDSSVCGQILSASKHRLKFAISP